MIFLIPAISVLYHIISSDISRFIRRCYYLLDMDYLRPLIYDLILEMNVVVDLCMTKDHAVADNSTFLYRYATTDDRILDIAFDNAPICYHRIAD